MTDLHIGFSHRYSKMPENCELTGAVLLDVWFSPKGTLSKEFIEYDTKYDGGNYPLGNNDNIILVLMSSGHLWTTVRRFEPKKMAYYKENIGKVFNIKVN